MAARTVSEAAQDSRWAVLAVGRAAGMEELAGNQAAVNTLEADRTLEDTPAAAGALGHVRTEAGRSCDTSPLTAGCRADIARRHVQPR